MNANKTSKIKVAVSGIPRGYHFPRPDGSWLQPHHIEQIRAVSPRIDLIEIPAAEAANTDLNGIEILLAEGGNRTHYAGELDWEDYQKFFTPSLRWVQLCSTGFSDNITPEIRSRKVTLTNAPGIHTQPIAESVLGAMLAHAKNFQQRRIDQKNKRWQQLHNDDLMGKTVLILGLGRIGQQTARLCKAFGMKVIGAKRKIIKVEFADEVVTLQDLPACLPKSDYIVIALPLTPATENLLTSESFDLMNSSAYLINVGRGKIVDETALLNALQNGRIAGAYLDALTEEPLPPDNPLWDLDNTFIVPHDSHSSPKIGDKTVDLFCKNLTRYSAGEPLDYICDPERGY